METRVFFPGLNGLRLIAAGLVALAHIGSMSKRAGYPSVLQLPHETGKLAVVFFFVLSGYLITYLLMREKEVSGTISVFDFFRRRILRIWPIYYLMVGVVFFVLPLVPALDLAHRPLPEGMLFWQQLALLVFMLPNVTTQAPYLSHFWSIGVEEQFYAIWPALVRFTSSLPLVLGCVIAGYWLLSFGVEAASGTPVGRTVVGPVKPLYMIVGWLRFDCMAIGGLAAVLVYRNVQSALTRVWSRPFQVALYAATLGWWLSGFSFHGTPYYGLYSVAFALIILNVATNPRTLIRLESRPVVYFGRVSYGIYVYHVLVIGFVLTVFDGLLGDREFTRFHTILLYPAVLLLTGLVSAVSYHAFEVRFLRMKTRYTRIQSGDQA